MKIRYSKLSLKFLSKLDKKSVMRIREAVEVLTMNPPKGDIKVMQGYTDGRKRASGRLMAYHLQVRDRQRYRNIGCS